MAEAETEIAAASLPGRLRPRSSSAWPRRNLPGQHFRDCDRLIQEKPRVQGPVFHSDDGRRRIVHLIWDWLGERRHTLHLHIARELPEGWEAQHYVLQHRAILRSELTIILERAGFTRLNWLYSATTGFHQQVVLARVEDAA